MKSQNEKELQNNKYEVSFAIEKTQQNRARFEESLRNCPFVNSFLSIPGFREFREKKKKKRESGN